MTKLQDIMQKVYNDIKINESPFMMGTSRYIATNNQDEDPDNQADFPHIIDPKGFVTHIPLEGEQLTEAEEDKPELPSDAGEAAADVPTEKTPEPTETPSGDEGGIGDMGMDASGNMPGVEGGMDMMPGATQEKEELTSNELGRVYEMKKIYSRLSSVETLLARTTDESMQDVRKMVSQAIDLFELVISNFNQYKENIDEIIVTYYELLNTVYTSLKEYFQDISEEQ